MTELSPQAQAVLDAVLQVSNLSPTVPVAAAALRAAADQVVPEIGGAFISPGTAGQIRAELLAIAAELDNAQ